MNKILFIGTVPINGKQEKLFCKVEFRHLGDNPTSELSITGVIGPRRTGNSMGGCGQIDMEFSHRNSKHNDERYNSPITPSQIKFAEEWNKELWLDLLDVWKKYHLNTMHAGCEHQRKYGMERNPDKYLGKRCLDCGYKFGTDWKSETIPQFTLSFLRGLPNSKIIPAWI